MGNRILDLDLKDKVFITIWIAFIALLLGGIEAEAFLYLDPLQMNFPFYWIMYAFMIFILLSIIPWMTRVKEDWVLTIGGSFLVQLFQDWGHWFVRWFFIKNWKIEDGFWTPIWNLLGVDFPIPLFWIIDIVIFILAFLYWYSKE